jgi:hypothetical protein
MPDNQLSLPTRRLLTVTFQQGLGTRRDSASLDSPDFDPLSQLDPPSPASCRDNFDIRPVGYQNYQVREPV